MGQEEIIAKRYAAGLAERAAETEEVAEVRRDLRRMASLVNPRAEEYVAEMADFLESPRVGAKEKIAAADAILGKLELCATARDFFKLLVGHGRAMLLPRIDAQYDALAGALTGEYAGLAETAMPLEPGQLERLEKALSGALGFTVRLRQQLEPGLVAGAKITVGDKIFDGSVLGKWKRLRNRLASGVATECALACESIDKSKGEPACEKS